MSLNPYNILNLETNCTDEEIKRAYKMAAKKNHPDTGGDSNKFALIKTAYDTLKDKIKREKFDQYGFIDNNEAMQQTNMAIQQLRQLFFSILQNSDPEIIESIDLIGSMKINITNKINDSNNNIDVLYESQNKTKKILIVMEKKLKCANKQPNFFVDMLKESLANIPNQIKAQEQQKAVMKEMLEILKDFSFDFSSKSSFFSSGFTSISVRSFTFNG